MLALSLLTRSAAKVCAHQLKLQRQQQSLLAPEASAHLALSTLSLSSSSSKGISECGQNKAKQTEIIIIIIIKIISQIASAAGIARNLLCWPSANPSLARDASLLGAGCERMQKQWQPSQRGRERERSNEGSIELTLSFCSPCVQASELTRFLFLRRRRRRHSYFLSLCVRLSFHFTRSLGIESKPTSKRASKRPTGFARSLLSLSLSLSLSAGGTRRSLTSACCCRQVCAPFEPSCECRLWVQLKAIRRRRRRRRERRRRAHLQRSQTLAKLARQQQQQQSTEFSWLLVTRSPYICCCCCCC